MNVAPDGGKDGAGCWHRVIAGRLAPGSSLQVPNIKLSEAWEQGLPVPLLLVRLPGKLPPLRTRHGPAFVCGVTPATRCSAQRAGMGQPHLMPPLPVCHHAASCTGCSPRSCCSLFNRHP